jgi:hypothetical protein
VIGIAHDLAEVAVPPDAAGVLDRPCPAAGQAGRRLRRLLEDILDGDDVFPGVADVVLVAELVAGRSDDVAKGS